MPGYSVLSSAVEELKLADGTNYRFEFSPPLMVALDANHVLSVWVRELSSSGSYTLGFRIIVWYCDESTVSVAHDSVLSIPYGGDTGYSLERIDHSTAAIVYHRSNSSSSSTEDRIAVRLLHWDGQSVSFGDEKMVYIHNEFGYPGWEYALETAEAIWDGAFLRVAYSLDTGDGPSGAAEGKLDIASFQILNKTLTRVDRRTVQTIPETGLGSNYYPVGWFGRPELLTDYRLALPYAVGYSSDDGGGWVLSLNLLRDGTIATAENVRVVTETPYVTAGDAADEIVVVSSPYGFISAYGTVSPYQMVARSMDINVVTGAEQTINPDEWTGIYMWSVSHVDRPVVSHINWDYDIGSNAAFFADLNADGSLLRDSGALLAEKYQYGEDAAAIALDPRRMAFQWVKDDGRVGFHLIQREPYIETEEEEELESAPSIVVPESISFESINIDAHLKDSLLELSGTGAIPLDIAGVGGTASSASSELISVSDFGTSVGISANFASAEMEVIEGLTSWDYDAFSILAEGLAWDGTHVWVSDRGDNIKKFDASGNQVGQIPYPPGVNTGRCQDITWDGTYIWVAEYDDRRVWQLDPSDGTVIHSVPAPDRGDGWGDTLDGLAWDGTNLWGAGRSTNVVYKFSPVDGTVLDQWSTLHPNIWDGGGWSQQGMTWKSDTNTLWIGDDFDTFMYEWDTSGTFLTSYATDPATDTRSFDWEEDNNALWLIDDDTAKVYRYPLHILEE